MSLRSYRVNKIEYGTTSDLFFGSQFRNYLEQQQIILNLGENNFQEEIEVERLKEFLENYENNTLSEDDKLDEEIEKEIEEYDFISYLTNELDYAEKNNLDYILYHIF